MTDQEQLEQAIHRASFGYRLTNDDATALMRAYMRKATTLAAREFEIETLKEQLESERAMNATLTQEALER
jgi:hypothetical protein